MKKYYLKPTARSHELRCHSMVAQSPQPLESHSFRLIKSDYDSDPDYGNDTEEAPMWAD